MKSDPILAPLNELARNRWSIPAEQLLQDHPFVDFDDLITVLTDTAVKYITLKDKGVSVSALLKNNPSLKIIIDEGDFHYYSVFHEGQLFNEDKEKHEEKKPLTRLFKALYNRLSGRKSSYSSQVIFYDDFIKFFIAAIAAKLIVREDINQYAHWKRIRTLFVNEWRFPENWVSLIPIIHLKEEAQKFNNIPAQTPLSKLADFGSTRKRNRPAIGEYLQSLERTRDFTTVKRLRELTEGNEYISLKNDRHFDLELLERLDAAEWLKLVDGLRYPIVQDHAFIFIKSTEFYERLVDALMAPALEVNTPKAELLFIILKNYLEAVFNIGYELSNYIAGRPYSDHPNLNLIQSKAAEINKQWLEVTLPDSFRGITDAILPAGKVDNEFGLLLIEWFSEQLPEEHPQFLQPIRNEIVKAMDAALTASIGKHIESSEYLITQVPAEVYNWKYFNLLSATDFAENNINGICERIVNKHLEYLRCGRFKWNNPNSFNNYFINQAFHFSVLLVNLPDVFAYWKQLYYEFRIYHEGWDYNAGADYIQIRKECYVLCTGIGIAYYLTAKDRTAEGEPFIQQILPQVIAQTRQNKRYSQLYLTPISFLFVYYEKYRPAELSDLVLQLVEKIDGVKLLLNIFGDLITPPVANLLSPPAKEKLRSRVSDEFFIISDRPDLMGLREEKQIYTKYRDSLLTALTT